MVPADPFYLPFYHHRQSFITNQGAPCRPEPLEAETGTDQALFSPVILLHDVVEILDLSQLGEVNRAGIAGGRLAWSRAMGVASSWAWQRA